MKRTLITSALPYANGYIHLGHAAGAYLPADIYARYLRLSGEEVLYVCGSDEHGVAITISAEKENTTPQQIIDKYHFANYEAFNRFGMSFDIYSRTSLPIHHETARYFFSKFLEKGYLIEKEEEQFYDPEAKMFLPDRYVEGVCPNCGYDKARGDQCDNCGAYYEQTELKNPISIISKKTPEVRKTSHWYFRFDLFQEFLQNYVDSHSKDWKDNVLAQTYSWLKVGMQPRPITRDLDWGVKIEGISGIDDEKAKGKRLYVWFDAVLGYITATKVWAKEHNDDWRKWWQSNDTRYIAFIGKDNIVFHTLIFPTFLYSIDENYILPDNVPANEFLNLEGEKFSKSRNWSIDLQEFINDFNDNSYIDALRYTLAMNFPETKDSDFTWKDFQARNNNELASILGNFINRTLQFLHKNFDGKVPVLSSIYSNFVNDWKEFSLNYNDEITIKKIKNYSENDYLVLSELNKNIDIANDYFNRFRFRDAILSLMNIARSANKYFNDEEPWKKIKTEPVYAAKTLFVCVQLVRNLAVLFAPVIPFTSEKIFKILNINSYTGLPLLDNNKNNLWQLARFPNLEYGHQTNIPEILFKQIEDDVIQNQINKLGKKETKMDADELIDIDYFKKIKLKTARIIKAEKLQKSKKLIKLQVEIDGNERQILAGLAEHYTAEELVGKTVVVVANLKPAKLMGEESFGMLLAASKDDKLIIVSPEKDIGSGASVS